MAKSRSFSVYLLKSEWIPDASLKDDHDLVLANEPNGLPADSQLFIYDLPKSVPWWKAYFGVQEELSQEQKGAVLFLKVKERYFAFSFGSVFHQINDFSYEHDFGLKVTLNSLDSNSLKSADTIDPGISRRKRTQIPKSGDLTFLDFDRDSEIIRSMTGSVKKKYRHLFKNATGSSSLKISLSLESNEIPGICETLLDLYESDEYKETFPNIQKVMAVKDPETIDRLNKTLITAVREKSDDVILCIPDIIDYRDKTCCLFRGDGIIGQVCPEIDIKNFYDFYEETRNIDNISLIDLKSYRVYLANQDGLISQNFSILKSLIYDVYDDDDESAIFHLSEGAWYQVEKSYAIELKEFLDSKYEDIDIMSYNHDNTEDGKSVYSEGNYNESVSVFDKSYICLDRKSIGPDGQNQIEPCDLYRIDSSIAENLLAIFIHVKISTDSSQLSHLFNQGANSVEYIKSDESGRSKMADLVKMHIGDNDIANYTKPLSNFNFKVIFAIITRKNPQNKSDNIPLFSKISLKRVFERLHLMSMGCAYTFIADESPLKGKFDQYDDVEIEIHDQGNNKKVARVLPGQKFIEGTLIVRCPKVITERDIGTKFRIKVKSKDGQVYTSHSWPYQEI